MKLEERFFCLEKDEAQKVKDQNQWQTLQLCLHDAFTDTGTYFLFWICNFPPHFSVCIQEDKHLKT